MRERWLEIALQLAGEEGDFYSGSRKIMRNCQVFFPSMDDDMTIKQCGFSPAKMTRLIHNYYHRLSIQTAKKIWEMRIKQKKYGSVCFTTSKIFLKSHYSELGKRTSAMGPCIQSVVLTWVPPGKTEIDVFYRTTEFFKKFPADLLLIRDVFLPEFDFTTAPISGVTFHFANLTVHPMYFIIPLQNTEDKIKTLENLKEQDRYFYNWVIKWLGRFFVPERAYGMAKFAQARRIHKRANREWDAKEIKEIQEYIRKNFPLRKGEKGESIQNLRRSQKRNPSRI